MKGVYGQSRPKIPRLNALTRLPSTKTNKNARGDPLPCLSQDRPPLCPFRLLPLLIYSGSTIAFLKILKVQGLKSKNIENVILLQP